MMGQSLPAAGGEFKGSEDRKEAALVCSSGQSEPAEEQEASEAASLAATGSF